MDIKMKNLTSIILVALVLIGLIGTIFVMQTETTAQATYQIYERPPVFQKILTTDKCEVVQVDLSLNREDCQNKARWDCTYKYPMTPGGAANYCLDYCINNAIKNCRD